MSDENRWSPSEVIAQQIQRRRKVAGWTRAQLAERCAEAKGAVTLTATVIGYIETGRRDANGKRRREVTIEELLILAKAFEVSPLLLLYPVDRAGDGLVEVLPGREVPVWMAAKWFTGEGPLGRRHQEGAERWSVHTDEFEPWRQNNTPLYLRREHDLLIGRWDDAKLEALSRRRAAELASTAAQRESELARADAAENRARETESRLRDTRKEMKRNGLTPPEVSPELNDALSPYIPEGGER
ncbi:helix-turn-helix domain-containing protein [Actinosynnema sp.]|uniref:helix-turn-helix domain-containing protein n=1 Tax=Actinosynnema sp. TaxID=1872144 RepID=UPI003F85DFE8